MARRRISTFVCALLGVAAAPFGCQLLPDEVATLKESEPSMGGAWGAGGTAPPLSDSSGGAGGEAPRLLTLNGDLEVHDPTVLKHDSQFFLFHTGTLLPLKLSTDLLTWREVGSAFEELPAWIEERLPGVTGLWAPHLSFFGGRFHLYYAASTFGSGRSCIGHASSSNLSVTTDWLDEGPVICSNVDDEVDFDAIDPAVFLDATGAVKMVFGSYGSGIQLIALTSDGLRADQEITAVAARPVEITIQAPAALYRAPYYYLFATFDRCCAGVNSTSQVRVGRSQNVGGPYVDRDGGALLEGAGTLLVSGDERFRAAGASGIFTDGARHYHAYHAYDANAAGRATLRIFELAFDEEGWPVPTGP